MEACAHLFNFQQQLWIHGGRKFCTQECIFKSVVISYLFTYLCCRYQTWYKIHPSIIFYLILQIFVTLFVTFNFLSFQFWAVYACNSRGEWFSIWCLKRLNDWWYLSHFIYPPLNTLTFTGWIAFLLKSQLSAVVSLVGERYWNGMKLNLNQTVQILAMSPSPPTVYPADSLSVTLTTHLTLHPRTAHCVFLFN